MINRYSLSKKERFREHAQHIILRPSMVGVSMEYKTSFIKTIIDTSDADNWIEAAEEWEIVSCLEDEERLHSCLCGKEGLRYAYTIRNIRNGNELKYIGSECIKKFERSELDTEIGCWNQVFKLIHEASKYHDLLQVPFKSPYYSRKLIFFFYKHGVFIPSKYNNGDPYHDYKFMIDMFNCRRRTERQECKLKALIIKRVRPFLLEVHSRASLKQTR